MGCCSAKKSTKGRKTIKKAGAKPNDKSNKAGAKKPAVPGANGKKGAAAASKNSTSSKRVAPKGKTPGAKGAAAPGAKSAPLQKGAAAAGHRPTKTPAAARSSAKSGPSSASSSSKKSKSSGGSSTKNPTDARLAKKRQSHAKSLNKAGVKGLANTSSSEVTTARSPPYVPKKLSKESPQAVKIPAPPSLPSPRDNKKKQQQQSKQQADKSSTEKKEKQADKSTSQSSSTVAARSSKPKPRESARVSRAKLPMQKLTVSSHIEDGIVVSQWYYTELRQLGTAPSSVADLLQGGPREQLNLPQKQQN